MIRIKYLYSTIPSRLFYRNIEKTVLECDFETLSISKEYTHKVFIQ